MCVFTQVFNGTELALEVALARLPPGAQPRRDESSGAAQTPIQVLLIGVCFQGRIVIRQLLDRWPPDCMLQRHQAGVCAIAAGRTARQDETAGAAGSRSRCCRACAD